MNARDRTRRLSPGGNANSGDTEILGLFKLWLAQSRAADKVDDDHENRWETILDHRDEIEGQILSIRGGAIGLAVKAYLYLRGQNADWAPSLADLRDSSVINGGPFHPSGPEAFTVSILRDAAMLVPEVGECSAAVIHDDAVLIDAEMGVGWCRNQLAGQHPAERRREIQRDLAELLDRVANTEAKTERGAAIKAALPVGQERDISNVVEMFRRPAVHDVAHADPPDAA
jgi:hypothetical protein